MKKTNIKPDHWVLLALRNASEGYGFDISKWLHFEKPDELEIKPNDIDILLTRLENEGLIKRALKDQLNFYLSEEGKKKLRDLKSQLIFKDYYSLISKFPDIELKDRIKALEAFVASSFYFFILIFLYAFIFSIFTNLYNTGVVSILLRFVLFLLAFSVVLVTFYTGINLGSILLFWTYSIKLEYLSKLKEFLWNNQGKILTFTSLAFIVFIILLFDYLGYYSLKDSIVAIALGLIVIWISSMEKINKEVLKLIGKYLKPP